LPDATERETRLPSPPIILYNPLILKKFFDFRLNRWTALWTNHPCSATPLIAKVSIGIAFAKPGPRTGKHAQDRVELAPPLPMTVCGSAGLLVIQSEREWAPSPAGV
jgi:hypothetical protein